MSSAVITLDFDPILKIAGWSIRWQMLATAGAILAALLAALWLAQRASAVKGLSTLRPDDLLFITVAIAPGALVGGRIAHVLAYLDYYRVNPAHIADPSQGGLSLLGAVVGGILSGAYMASLLGVPVRRWLDVASMPLLLAIGLGKLGLVLGGEGQGTPSGGTWALAFGGPGPWYTPAPAVPAHPAQVYEALWALSGIVVLIALRQAALIRRLPAAVRRTGAWVDEQEARGAEAAPDQFRFGVAFFVALVWWLAGRIVVGFAWRDDPLLGGLNAEQLMAAAVLGATLLGAVVRSRIRRTPMR